VARVRHLARAPLREAIIDIQLVNPLEVSFAEGLADLIIPGFERKNEIRQFSVNITAAGPLTPIRTEELLGWRYESEDGARIVQLRRNGIGYSITREYTEWADIKAAARAVWEVYRERSGDRDVARVAVRYINVLNLPPWTELNTYLTAAPQVPEGLPQTLTHFLERIVVPFDEGIFAIIIQTMEQGAQAATRVILDIDVYAQRVLGGSSPDLWFFLDRLREVKNAVFFSSVTERTLEAYE
jgi:uncharacterized protein (TIGR04255 family)